jgi:DNA-binding beta-propeller fold protein YncE
VAVIDIANCNAEVTAGCATAPAVVAVPYDSWAIAVDQSTDSVYVSLGTNGVGGVAVFDGATCNGTTTTGCSRTPTTVPTGSGQVLGLAVDQATNTIYVSDTFSNAEYAPGDTISVLDGAACNATVTSGCNEPSEAVTVGLAPWSIAVDEATDTVYVTNYGPEFGDTVSMINGATCNSATTSGCDQVPPTVTVGYGPMGIDVDQATGTIFVGDNTQDTVAICDGTRCNSTDTSGCPQTAPQVPVRGNPSLLSVDQATGTVLVPNLADNDLSVLSPARLVTCSWDKCSCSRRHNRVQGRPLRPCTLPLTST